MSFFLVYFEKNNPDVPWTAFENKRRSVTESFTKVNDNSSQLIMDSVEITLVGKPIRSYIIHDGISSDRLFNKKLSNIPVVEKQRAVVRDFFKDRLEMNVYDQFFIFHLYHGLIPDKEGITYSDVAEVKLSDLMNFTIDIERDILYKLVN
jgi:hypothetical protein